MIIEIKCLNCGSPNLSPGRHPYNAQQQNVIFSDGCIICADCYSTYEFDQPRLKEVGQALRYIDPLTIFNQPKKKGEV